MAVRSRERPEMASFLVRKRRSWNVSPASRVDNRMRSCAVDTLTLLLKYFVAVELYATGEETGSGATS